MKFISIIMGRGSDLDIANEAAKVLESFGVKYEMIVSSAHRSPQRTHDYVVAAQNKGCEAFICIAGMAAHLAGVVASLTTKPVLGVPAGGGALGGVDSLYSTVQMPGGIPVATFAVGKAGAKNAAYFASQILSLSNEELALKIKNDRANMAKKVCEDSSKIEIILKEDK